MVAGAAGGGHKTAAVVDTDDQLDDSEPIRCNTRVYKDDELTRSTLVASVRAMEVDGAHNGVNGGGGTAAVSESMSTNHSSPRSNPVTSV